MKHSYRTVEPHKRYHQSDSDKVGRLKGWPEYRGWSDIYICEDLVKRVESDCFQGVFLGGMGDCLVYYGIIHDFINKKCQS